MAKDIHKSTFDDGTLIKLYILREYIKEWIPVFTRKKDLIWKRIFIYDYFAGEGADIDGNFGSPLIILDELRLYCKVLREKIISCNVSLNEYDKTKFDILKKTLRKHIDICRLSEDCPNKTKNSCAFTFKLENKSFQDLFLETYEEIHKVHFPRFMFLDQYGIKQISEEIFIKLVNLKRTDFMFFISSSFANRFINLPEFAQYLKLTRQEFDIAKSYHCHRVIFNYYKKLIPEGTPYYLAPFSIKKGSNIYGLIFGSSHTLGIEKFLNICWKINENTGDANFDIDNERIDPTSPRLFPEMDRPNKLQFFGNELKNEIRLGKIKTNREIYSFTFDMGCLPVHANEVVKELRKEKVISDIKTVSKNVHKLDEQEIILLKR